MNSPHGLYQEHSVMAVGKTKGMFGYLGFQCDVNQPSSVEVIKEKWFPSAEAVPAPCWKHSSSPLSLLVCCSGSAAQGGSVRARVCVLMLLCSRPGFSLQNQNCSVCFVFRAVVGAGVSCCLGSSYQEILTCSLLLFSTSGQHTWRMDQWKTTWSSQPCTSPAGLFNIPQPWASCSAFSAPHLPSSEPWGSPSLAHPPGLPVASPCPGQHRWDVWSVPHHPEMLVHFKQNAGNIFAGKSWRNRNSQCPSWHKIPD